MRHGSLFSGLGGFDLAASWVGWENTFHSDIDPFCLTVLKHHFPYATTYSDIRGTDFTPWYNRIDVLSGGFPCPPFSQAGKRKGTADDRYLWPEMYRAIQQIRPRWVVAENVLGIVNWNKGVVFEQVHLDLEAAGYSVQTFVLPACGVNAPHQRYRTWFVAHRDDDQLRAGLPFDQWDWTTSATDGCTDVRYAYGADACAQPGSADGPHTEYGRVCGAGSHGTAQDGNGRGSRTHPADAAADGISSENESRAASDSDVLGHERRTEGRGEEQIPSERPQLHLETERSGVQQTAANSQSGGFQRRCPDGGRPDGNQTQRPEILHGIEGSGAQRPITDTDGTLPQYGNDEAAQGWDFKTFGTESSGGMFCWEGFPTFAPVLRGDDGFSEILHGISFPRWRRESIKAYGNAIVPQLAYRIFRVIDYMSNGR